MMAFAWKMLLWFGIGVAVALSVLIVPLHVAAERKKLDMTTAAIVQAKRDIRALETEFETRANIAQLERWNGETLRLAAPVAAQFMRDEAALAALDFHNPLGGTGEARMAAIVPSQQPAVPSGPSGPSGLAGPAVLQAAAVTAAPATVAPIRVAAVGGPAVQSGTVAPVRTAIVQRKAQAMAMLDRKLLSDSMIGDLVSGANAEAGRLR